MLDDQRKQLLDQAWMESLLIECVGNDQEREESRLKELFASPELQSAAPKFTQVTVSKKSPRVPSWAALSIAAALMIAFGGWWLFRLDNQRAYAAVARSMQSVSRAREYAIHIRGINLQGNPFEREAQLFVDSQDRYMIHHSGLLGGDVWYGDDGTKKWFVPKVGPALIADEWLFSKWLTKKDDSTPYLHLNTILKRMGQGYRLDVLPDESVVSMEDGKAILCEHIRGVSTAPPQVSQRPAKPLEIELWADKSTGIAQRVAIKWKQREHEAGPIQWTIELKRFPDLEPDWFTPQSHMRRGQRIVQVGNEADADTKLNSNLESY